VGLFSVLDALMDAPMEETLDKLPISEVIIDALLKQEGPQGEVLKSVLAYERGDWGNVSLEGLSATTIRNAYLDAITWVGEVDGAMSAKEEEEPAV